MGNATGLIATRGGDPWKGAVAFLQWFGLILQELGFGIWHRTIYWPFCVGMAAISAVALSTRLDLLLWEKTRFAEFYPYHPVLYAGYSFALVSAGFWAWAIRRLFARKRLVATLTEAFKTAGLTTRTGRCPGFVSDRALDAFTRRMKLSPLGIPISEFEKAKPSIETSLQIWIDELKSNRERGTIDLLYSHYPMKRLVELETNKAFPRYQFVVGETRSKQLCMSLREVPHLLVGGLTNKGKSTFLRQFITTLYLNNPTIEFSLIDLKRGLEFQLFEGLKRIQVYMTTRAAIQALRLADANLEKRMGLLRANRCENLDEFLKLPEDKRAYPADWPKGKPLSRHVIVIDEAAELFLAGSSISAKDAQAARRLASTIAAQGRAAGVHLVVATQRPDRNAVDPLTKTHLQGRLCFQMADNASSMTILDSGRAADLPGDIPGRAIWKSGMDYVEVQTPYLPKEKANELLDGLREEAPDVRSEAEHPLAEESEGIEEQESSEDLITDVSSREEE